MISFIKGNIEILKENFLVIENNGIGYKINISGKLYTYLSISRENIKLYTFIYAVNKINFLIIFYFIYCILLIINYASEQFSYWWYA